MMGKEIFLFQLSKRSGLYRGRKLPVIMLATKSAKHSLLIWAILRRDAFLMHRLVETLTSSLESVSSNFCRGTAISGLSGDTIDSNAAVSGAVPLFYAFDDRISVVREV